MKGLLLGLVLLVLFVHFGGPNVPKVLKDNKQMVYGVTIGLVLCSFFGVNVEGISIKGTPFNTEQISCMEEKCSGDSPPSYCQCLLSSDFVSFDKNYEDCLSKLLTPAQEFYRDIENCTS